MKITRTVKGCIESTVMQDSNMKYEDTIQHITAAIESLAPYAKEDAIAKEAMADLSVSLFSLKSCVDTECSHCEVLEEDVEKPATDTEELVSAE